jgi:hypothetical protein
VAEARDVWINRRQPFMRNMLTRIGFIDETSLKTNMAKTTGWSLKGARLMDHSPFGHWNTRPGAPPVRRRNLSTGQISGRASPFIAALRHDRPDAPRVIGGPVNREFFDLHVQTQRAQTLQKGDVVILDNLATQKSPKTAAILKNIGAWFRRSGKAVRRIQSVSRSTDPIACGDEVASAFGWLEQITDRAGLLP